MTPDNSQLTSEPFARSSASGPPLGGSAPPSDAYAIPDAAGRKRLSPALDPLARLRVAAIAKWLLVVGILMLIFGAPFFFPYVPQPSDSALSEAKVRFSDASAAYEKAQKIAERKKEPDEHAAALKAVDARQGELAAAKKALAAAATQYETKKIVSDRSNFSPVLASAILAAILATGVPRLLLPAVFGRWHEAVEAFRDWIVVGFATGVPYLIALAVFKSIKAPEDNAFLENLIGLRDAKPGVYDPIWLEYRLPIILICALIGLLIARRIALRGEGLVARNPLKATFEVLVQAALIGALIRPLEHAFDICGQTPVVGPVLATVGTLLVAGGIGVVGWAYDADRHAAALHRRGHPVMTGIDADDRPVPMTISVIGGRESGKTVLMAAAYYEWLTTPFGQLRIKPAPSVAAGRYGNTGTDLEQVADELYVRNQFPVGTVSTQDLPFDIAFGKDPVCRFSMLDFPGGAVVGRAADQAIVQQFWDRLENSDALLIIADMSYVRRGRKDPGFMQVFAAYREAMRRLIDRNGKRRVVPVALVLTKCDEYTDPATGRLNHEAIRTGLQEFGYSGLEAEWRQMCQQEGQQVVEFSTWMTTAITFSEPQRDANGEYDYTKPFKIIPPPPAITPTGCAAPILWLSAKVMRWNVTAFRDISSFLIGSSPTQRRRIEAVREIERVADEKQAKG